MDNIKMPLDKVTDKPWIINPDDIIGGMAYSAEEAQAIIDTVESTYFHHTHPTEEDLLRIRAEYGRISKMLRASITLLSVAKSQNDTWQNRETEQIKYEAFYRKMADTTGGTDHTGSEEE